MPNGVRHYQDLTIWQTAFALTKLVYSVSKRGAFARDFGLRDQIRRASVSVMSNIAEGFSRESRLEFIRFLDIARSSAMEVHSVLQVAEAEGYISKAELEQLEAMCSELRRQITTLIRHLRSTKYATD